MVTKTYLPSYLSDSSDSSDGSDCSDSHCTQYQRIAWREKTVIIRPSMEPVVAAFKGYVRGFGDFGG